MCTISVLIPAKNVEAYISECLESIIHQSFEDWEAIIVNDHSSDNTLEIIDVISKHDHRIIVKQNPGEGIISALRTAFKHSKGLYVTRMDADDLMTPQKLEILLQKLKFNGTGYIAIGLVKYFSKVPLGEGYKKYELWLNELTKADNNFEDIYKECPIPSPNWLVHRSDLHLAGAFNSNIYPEDYDLAFRFRAAKLKTIGVPITTHLWRDYPSRSSRTDPHYSDNSFIKLKVSHFIKQDYKMEKTLVIWGAGKKGKKIAAAFIANQIPILWVTNNPKKIGVMINEVKLQSNSVLNKKSDAQVIIAISQRNTQAEISAFLRNKDHIKAYYFC